MFHGYRSNFRAGLLAFRRTLACNIDSHLSETMIQVRLNICDCVDVFKFCATVVDVTKHSCCLGVDKADREMKKLLANARLGIFGDDSKLLSNWKTVRSHVPTKVQKA